MFAGPKVIDIIIERKVKIIKPENTQEFLLFIALTERRILPRLAFKTIHLHG